MEIEQSNSSAMPTSKMEINVPQGSMTSEYQSPPLKPKKGILKGQKKVRFAVSSTGVYVDTKSESELESSWYTEKEVEKMKSNALKAAKGLMEESAHVARAYIEQTVSTDSKLHGKFTGIKHVCGIEHLLCRAVCGMLLSTRSESILAVIDEQQRQQECGVNNPQMLAQIYMQKSLFARVWRHRVAVLNCSDWSLGLSVG